MIAPVLTSTLTVCRQISAIRCLYIGLRVRYKYYKKQSFGFVLEPAPLQYPTRRLRSKSAHKYIPYNRYVHNFIQIG